MSTIKVTNIEHASTANGGIQLDNAGHVTVDGQQLPTAGALSNRNLIINGAMNVAQRGTSSTTSGYGTVDRFRPSYVGGQITQTQENMTTSDSPYSLGFRKFFRLQNTTATADPPAATNHRRFLIRLEAQDIANSGWDYTSSSSYITLSMWVRSSVSQTFTWFAQTIDGTQQNYAWDVTLTANTWTKITESFPGNSNITIDNDNELGLMFDCGMFWGTQYTDSSKTNDAWSAYSSTARTKDFDDTWATTTNATFDVTGVQLEVGEKATPFEHRSFGDELARCQRYFQKSYSYEDAPGTVTNGNRGNDFVYLEGGNTTAHINLKFYPEMRITPNITTYSIASANTPDKLTASSTDYSTGTNATVNSAKNFLVFATGVTAADDVYVAWTGDAEL